MSFNRRLASVVAVAAFSSAQADIINVGPGDSIQDAIDVAMDGDEIIVAPGTYFETIDFIGKAIWLHSSDGADVTTIDGTGNFHVVQCVSGEGPDTVLDGFTVTGGDADGTCPDNCRGGGMFNDGSSPTVTNCTFKGNTALVQGGGMYNLDSSSPTVTNCTFIGNTGSGMFNFACSPTVTNCTFSGNTGRGMDNGGGSNPTVTNCILWNNGSDEIFGPATVAYSDVQGGFPGIGNIDADPLFVDPDNGGLRLSPGSPCIDAGDNTAVPDGIDTDLDGNARFVDDPDTPDTGFGDPPVVDMGAYEFQGIPCPWDLDGDGNVFVIDLLLLLMDFGSCDGSPADFDGDGCVTVVDLLTLLFNFGPCPDGRCPWDVNGDRTVDAADLWQVLGNFGPCDGCPEDVNGDGIVNGLDVSAVATHFGPCP